MRRIVVCVFLVGCSTSSSNDGGSEDAPLESMVDVCDLDAFFASGGNDKPCPMVSARLCFQTMKCPMTYCKCTNTGGGPRWKCMTDPGCFPEAGSDAGEDAPIVDAPVDAPSDAANE